MTDVEELKNLDASEIHARRRNAKEVLVRKNGDEFIFLCADGMVKLAAKDQGVQTFHPYQGPARQRGSLSDSCLSVHWQGEPVSSQLVPVTRTPRLSSDTRTFLLQASCS